MRYERHSGLFLGALLALFAQVANSADFSLPDINGKQHKLSDYRGQWVLVNYWTTWCPPCIKELPDLETLHSESNGKAVVLAVNIEDIELPELRDFVDEKSLSFPVLVAGSDLPEEEQVGDIPIIPTSYLISPEGKPVARQVGPVTAKAIREFIRDQEAK